MRNTASRIFTVAVMLLALAACSTDSPTAPQRTPAPPPGSGTPTAWNITVTAEPRNLTASDSQPATITVRVRRASDGTAPQNGTTVVVAASLGDFNSSGSDEKTATLSLSSGLAQVLYFAGSLLGTDIVQAQLESSVGTARVNILEAEVLFLEGVRPSVGPEGGGTRIRISGTGFSEPARVELGSSASVINATVDAVGQDSEGEFIRAITGPVFDADTFFEKESCDSDGDGTTDGERYLSTTVDVNVIFTDGNASLSNAFTYVPNDGSCRDITPDPDKPNAKFSFTVNNTTVLFNNESSPAGLTFNWIFGDGVGTSASTNPVYTYPLVVLEPPFCAGSGTPPCSFSVTLRAINSSGEDTTTKTVTITTLPP